jgi:hypothetical protein
MTMLISLCRTSAHQSKNIKRLIIQLPGLRLSRKAESIGRRLKGEKD